MGKQKRSFYIHILLWLEHFIASDNIDNVISAEISHSEQDSLLYDIMKANIRWSLL